MHGLEGAALLAARQTCCTAHVEDDPRRPHDDGNDAGLARHAANGVDGQVDVGSRADDGVVVQAMGEGAIVDHDADFGSRIPCRQWSGSFFAGRAVRSGQCNQTERVEMGDLRGPVGAGVGCTLVKEAFDDALESPDEPEA
jgi:hypothetical protein